MGLGSFGLPSEQDVIGLMGFVTDEDREKWAKQKEAQDAQVQRSRGKASVLVKQAVGPGLEVLQQDVNMKMQALRTGNTVGQKNKAQSKRPQKTTTTTFTETETLDDDADYELG